MQNDILKNMGPLHQATAQGKPFQLYNFIFQELRTKTRISFLLIFILVCFTPVHIYIMNFSLHKTALLSWIPINWKMGAESIGIHPNAAAGFCVLVKALEIWSHKSNQNLCSWPRSLCCAHGWSLYSPGRGRQQTDISQMRAQVMCVCIPIPSKPIPAFIPLRCAWFTYLQNRSHSISHHALTTVII